MNTKGKLFLLDAYALIFRAYYAFINRPIKNSKGINTSAIFGFVSSLDEVLRKEKPTHIAVAFDPPSLTFRHNLFPAYKANRLQTPEDIRLSVPYIKKILGLYKMPILEYTGFEADDVIGTVAKTASKEGYQIFMMTPDKDYAQLVEENIFMFKPRRSGNDNEIWGIEEVIKNFEISTPLQVIDILALWGDSSDNIPGAPGIGEKTAKKLIAEYGNVENLLANTNQLKGKVKESLETNYEQIKLSKILATIDINVPVTYKIDELICKVPDYESLKKLFEELEFRTLSKRIIDDKLPSQKYSQGSLFESSVPQGITVNLVNNSTENSIFQTFDADKVKYQIVKDNDQIDKLIKSLENQPSFCFDTETTGLDVLNADIVGLAISFIEKEAFYLPFDDNFERSRITLNKFRYLFNNKNIIKVGHNIKYDLQILQRYDIEVQGPYFDTMVAHYLLHPENKHKLDNLTENILRYKMISIEELIGKKGIGQLNMKDIDIETIKDYACEDADFTFRLFNIFSIQLKESGMDILAFNIEMPLIDVLKKMEIEGFNIDIKSLNEFEKELDIEIHKQEDKIYSLAGEKFNIASPRQMGIILFEKLKISANTKMTKTKQYSTNEEVLSKLSNEHPIISEILDYRTLTKLQSTYVTTLPKLINTKTGRIHSSFSQTIAATGRLSSINPNLQNIPIRDARGREIRKSFIPSSKEFTIVSADYSQIELRIMAHLSNDKNMIDAFKNGEDIHRSTAAKVYKIKDEDVTREMRSKAKTANFGIIYGISAFGLAQRLNIPRSEAKELIDNYFISFPDVKKYMELSIENAKSKGFVTTLFDRRRYLPDIHSNNSLVRGVAERNAINSPIQGTAADIIKIAMINIDKTIHNNFKSKMILQVHDELVFNVYKPEINELKVIIKNEMENATLLKVPLNVEIGVGENWLEAH
jgi:DNA polymerase I